MSLDNIFEETDNLMDMIDQHNELIGHLDEEQRYECILRPTDSPNQMKHKCARAYSYGAYHYPLISNILAKPVVEDVLLVGEAASSTERVRKYYKKHPGKVRQYLKKTAKDRAARNRDRRRAVKKHGKEKMKNHDVHHPNGPHGGNWQLARKDHGRDKKPNKNESILLQEGGAAGHLLHPYEDPTLTFGDLKSMVSDAMIGQLNTEAPVTEKLDGMNILFTIKDGHVFFARNKGQIKNSGQNALSPQELAQKFGGRGEVETAFMTTAEDVESALANLPPEEIQNMFGSGRRFMNAEIVYSGTKNVVSYDKNTIIFHGTIEYDDAGNEVGRSIEHGQELAKAINDGNSKQKTYHISGPQTIAFSDGESDEYKIIANELNNNIQEIENQHHLSDTDTIESYLLNVVNNKLRDFEKMQGYSFNDEERKGLIHRWVSGDKTFRLAALPPEVRVQTRDFEIVEIPKILETAKRPIESVILKTGVYAIRRSTNLLAANDPEAAGKLKKELYAAITAIRDSGDENKLEKLEKELKRLHDLGIDNIASSEGIVFVRNGKPYKFTGSFAPINQIMGILKFSQPTNQATTPPANENQKKKVVVLPGRFQPFHSGHYDAYKTLVEKFGKENVFIVTSDLVKPDTAPLDFEQKKHIMTTMFDIPLEQIAKVKQPFAPTELIEKFPPETQLVVAYSEKDANRSNSIGKYYKPYKDDDTDVRGYRDAGYITVVPEFELDIAGHNVSGSQIRAVFGDKNVSLDIKQRLFKLVYRKDSPESDGIFDELVSTFEKSQAASKEIQADKIASKEKWLSVRTNAAKRRDAEKISGVKAKPKEKTSKELGFDPTARIENPTTQRSILVKSALTYPRDSKVYRAAIDYIQNNKT